MLTVVLTRRTSGQGPSARLRNGLVSQSGSASRAARANSHSRARPAPPDQPLTAEPGPRTTPRSGSDPRQAATRSPAPNSQGSTTAAAIRLRRSVCASGRPACPQVSRCIGLSGNDREFL